MRREKVITDIETTIVTEGAFDAEVLKKILQYKSFHSYYRIIPANGSSSALSKAKTLLTLNNKVILLLDTDSVDEDSIGQKKDFVESYVNTVGKHDKFKAIWAVPEFEIIFLENKRVVDQLIPGKRKDLIEIGKMNPKVFFEKMNLRRENFLSILNQKDICLEFFNNDLILKICDFIDQTEKTIKRAI